MSVEIRKGALLRRSPLSGRVYVVTRWKVLPNGVIEALDKFDVTEQFDTLADQRSRDGATT